MLRGDIEKTFTHHPPKPDQVTRYEQIRAAAKEFAVLVSAACPDSREKSLAITSIQQSVMWANAAIAIGESEG